ncbi:phospholipase A2 inhibitor and Ly6/PLAUR domain-containing protein-like [Mantella aurantiaca]
MTESKGMEYCRQSNPPVRPSRWTNAPSKEGKSYSLTCIECSAAGDKACNGSSEVCPSGNYACLLTRVENTMGEMVTSRVYIRQCGLKDLCSKTGSMSLPNSRFKTSVTCCDTDNCTPPDPILPEISGEKNGVHCPACYVPNAKSCDTKTLMECAGNETICITQLTTLKGPVPSSIVARGCATKQLCKPAHQVWNINKSVVVLENFCVNSGSRLHKNVLTLILSISVLLKLLC